MTEETKDGYASLYVAIQEGNIEAAELLIKCGTNVNDHYERNRTPLHIAIGRKQLEIAKLLIKMEQTLMQKLKIMVKMI